MSPIPHYFTKLLVEPRMDRGWNAGLINGEFMRSLESLQDEVERHKGCSRRPQSDHRADYALSSVCRVVMVVNSDWHNLPIKFESTGTGRLG